MEGLPAFRQGVPNRRLVEDGTLASAITLCVVAVEDDTPMAATRPCSTTYYKVVSENTVLCSTVYVGPGVWGQTASTQGVLWVPR